MAVNANWQPLSTQGHQPLDKGLPERSL